MIGGSAQAATYGAVGSAGQVWTSNGAGADPTFQPGGTGGGVGYQRGLTASKAACAAGTNGTIYYATDSPLSYGCNGTSYQAYDGSIPVTPPGALASYTSVTDNGTLTQRGDAILFEQNAGSANKLVGITSATTITTSSTVTAGFSSIYIQSANSVCGAGIVSTAVSPIVTYLLFGPSSDGSGRPAISYHNQGVTFASTAAGPIGANSAAQYRWRYVSTTSVIPEISLDGGTRWFNPTGGGIPSTVNPVTIASQAMGVYCNNNGTAGASVLLTHATFQ